MTAQDRLAEWHRYYSPKRVIHQCQQLHMLGTVDVRSVLEVGPYLGFVTALLDNAGYEVATFDMRPKPEDARHHHIQGDLAQIRPGKISGFEAILCCETLEHLPWSEITRVMAMFRASGARYLLLSVPYEGAQITLNAYVNRFTFRKYTSFKFFRSFRKFQIEADPFGHKWEVGYRGHSLSAYQAKIETAGWRIIKREFTATTRSVFHLCERRPYLGF